MEPDGGRDSIGVDPEIITKLFLFPVVRGNKRNRFCQPPSQFGKENI